MPPAPVHVGRANSSVGELLLLVFPYSGQSDVLVLSDSGSQNVDALERWLLTSSWE